MTCLVFAHLMYGIMDCVQILLFSQCSDTFLVLACASLSFHTLFQVSLRIPNYVAKKLCELSSVLSLFPSVTLECLSYLRITLTVCLTAHGQIHTNFGTFSHKVSVQTFQNHWVYTFSNT